MLLKAERAKLRVLCGCIGPNADLGTRADGKKGQEAGILCKVRLVGFSHRLPAEICEFKSLNH